MTDLNKENIPDSDEENFLQQFFYDGKKSSTQRDFIFTLSFIRDKNPNNIIHILKDWDKGKNNGDTSKHIKEKLTSENSSCEDCNKKIVSKRSGSSQDILKEKYERLKTSNSEYANNFYETYKDIIELHKGGNKNSINIYMDNCEEKFIKPSVKRGLEFYDTGYKLGQNILKKQKQTKKTKKQLKKSKDNYKKKRQDYSNLLTKRLKSYYCNPGCKGTLLEPGKKLSGATRKKLLETHKHPILVKIMEEERKKQFGNKSTLLDKDSFYNKLNKTRKNKYKKDGALSFCTYKVDYDKGIIKDA